MTVSQHGTVPYGHVAVDCGPLSYGCATSPHSPAMDVFHLVAHGVPVGSCIVVLYMFVMYYCGDVNCGAAGGALHPWWYCLKDVCSVLPHSRGRWIAHGVELFRGWGLLIDAGFPPEDCFCVSGDFGAVVRLSTACCQDFRLLEVQRALGLGSRSRCNFQYLLDASFCDGGWP